MEMKNISELEWNTYERSFEIFTNSLIPPSLMIYLDVSPDTALKRIYKRDRQAEMDISDNFTGEEREEAMHSYLKSYVRAIMH